MSRKLWTVLITLLLSSATLSIAAPIPAPSLNQKQVDPFGRPLPTREQARARLEQLLGRPIVDPTPIQHSSTAVAAPPYDGPDVPVAYTLSDAGELAATTGADLAETPDVKFTPEVLDTVARLGANPEQLYLYVKNQYTFTPYVGSQKGSRGTELEFAGNDFDQASLLIALLRAAGIPARYVFGSMYIKLDDALSWLGVDNATAAIRVLSWQGVPARLVKAGGGSLLVDRVWVEALVDRHGPKPRWVPMDPAFKLNQIIAASPLATSVPFNESDYLHLAPSDQRTPFKFLSDNLQNYLNTASPGTTVDDIERQSSIIPTVFTKGLPGRLENRVKIRGEAPELTDGQRYLVTVSTVDAQGLSAQANLRLPEVYGQRLTVSFPPATAADQALVQSYGEYYNTPADQLHVVPAIKLNGQAIATGSRPVSIGDGHFVVVDLFFPGAIFPNTLFHVVFAGGFYGLGLDAPGDASFDLDARTSVPNRVQTELASPDPQYDDSTSGETLYDAAWSYLDNVQSDRLNVGALFSGIQVMDVSEALTMKNIRIEYVNGVLRFRPVGFTVDARRIAGRLFSDNGDDSNASVLADMEGLGSSLLESRLWDWTTGLLSISTTRGLQVANANGIPIYRIDQSNIGSLLPTMNVFPDVLQNVEQEVSSGFTVTIPRDTIVMNQWAGSIWIEESPDGMSTAYLIEGGLFGGSTTQDPKDRKNKNPSCSDLDQAFDTYSGDFNSDFGRAVAARESSWTQFDSDGDPFWGRTTPDVGIMQVNDPTWSGQSLRLPDGTTMTVDDQQLENNWQYNVEVGSAILNNDLIVANRYLRGLGVNSPSDSDLITVAYYIYNHGSNIPPGFAYDSNGVLQPVSYSIGPKLTAKRLKGVQQAQKNSLAVQGIFNNQKWPQCQ